MSKSERTTNDTYDLVMGTVKVINEALEEHEGGRAFAAVVSLTDRMASGKEFGVAVYRMVA